MSRDTPLISAATVTGLGVSQLVVWGISYYLVGALGERMVADLGWERVVVYGGFSTALVVMGVVSSSVGRAIDHFGGRPIMSAGSLLLGTSCAWLAASHSLWSYYGAWILMGVAMRMTLYDAAFATLARLGGPHARRPISQITLLGGLASTVFWPIGFYLAELLGWRGAVFAYAGIAVCTLPLHITLPRGRYGDAPPARRGVTPAAPQPAAATAAQAAPAETAETAEPPPGTLADQLLFAVMVMLATFLNSGVSAHLIGMLSGLGMAAALAVWVSALRGVGQSCARLAEILFGRRLHPLMLALGASGMLPLGFVFGLFSGQWAAAGVAFALFYGAANGLLTIVRGALPLVLFDHRIYGRLTGRLVGPSFALSAFAPLSFALAVQHFGPRGSMVLSMLVAALVFGCALLLRLRHRV